MDLLNCPNCGTLYIKNPVRDVCDQCFKAEEAAYDKVYKFLRIRENRAATIERVAVATEVEEALLHKWVRKGRLQTAQFPNMGYPCDKCGKIISKGKLCEGCATTFKQELGVFEMEQERQEEFHKGKAYHSQEKR